jgi:hypothetical protein
MTRKLFMTGAVIAVAGLVPAPAASAHHGCSAHARGGKITHKTRESHVFEKNDHWYGCAAKVGRPRLLPGLDTITARRFGDGTVPTHITLSGVFVAYERYTIYPAGGAGDTQTDLYVVDLRNGKVVVDEDATAPRPQTEDRWVDRIVLKRNGSVGWISTRETYGVYPDFTLTYEVHRHSLDPAAPGRATLDEGTDIDRESLRLSADRRAMTWTRGGQPKSAALP